MGIKRRYAPGPVGMDPRLTVCKLRDTGNTKLTWLCGERRKRLYVWRHLCGVPWKNRAVNGNSTNRWEREMFYLTTHSTHFIYGYMVSDILIVREETRCRHIGCSYRLTARVLLYAPSHRQDNTYHGLCYTSRGALAGTRNSSMGPPHEGSLRRPIAPWAMSRSCTNRQCSILNSTSQTHFRPK